MSGLECRARQRFDLRRQDLALLSMPSASFASRAERCSTMELPAGRVAVSRILSKLRPATGPRARTASWVLVKA